MFSQETPIKELKMLSNQKVVLVNSWGQIVKVPMVECDLYSTCGECTADPYCYWEDGCSSYTYLPGTYFTIANCSLELSPSLIEEGSKFRLVGAVRIDVRSSYSQWEPGIARGKNRDQVFMRPMY